ncbi:MAG: GIY-YIG nuclease family protein [Ktedonobacteraceae bacterium]
MHTVYALIDPRSQEVRYIGITYNVYQRMRQHSRCEGHNKRKNAWIEELQQEQLMFSMHSLENVGTFDEALARELYWIKYYLNAGASLTNLAGVPKEPHYPDPNKRCYRCCHILREVELGYWSCVCGLAKWHRREP